MTPQEFVRKWRPVALTERQTAQEHFGDLCRLLGEPTPIEADPEGIDYAFEKGANRATGGRGWADVWKRGRFAIEYKKRHANLGAALKQLLNYAGALANPPLLLTCDTDRIEINTNWNDVVSTQIVIRLEELLDPEKLQILKTVFTDPDALKPVKKRADVTAEAAKSFASLADRLRRRGHRPEQVAHFVNQLLFCLFAQDSQLFEDRLFEKFLRQARRTPTQAESLLRGLFGLMAKGGLYGLDRVEWFNGSLFKDDVVLPLDKDDLKILEDAALMNWSAIEPAIFGTLFERGLDPSKRSQLGAHYTDATMIGRIVDAVITKPLLAEWAEVREQITQRLSVPAPESAETTSQKRRKASSPSLFASLPTAAPAEPRQRIRQRAVSPESEAKEARDAFLDRLRKFRVLDPACGSGNFLYVALMALKDIELQVIIEGEELGIARVFPMIGPDSVLGLEINSYAVELARVTVWIGEIQWMRRKGYDFSRSPVLNALPGIVEQDAILDPVTGQEPAWPPVDVIVGNPPFLGSKFHLRRLGGDYVQRLRAAYAGRVPPGADLVCYWFEKARAMAAGGQVHRVGLLATKSIANAEPSRQVLDRIVAA
jgi:type II restriction/modification system DNA methylase subunit YeeA